MYTCQCGIVEILSRIGVFLLDGDREHAELLTSFLTKDALSSTLVVLTADMSRPWGIMESLNNWTTLLQDHLKRLGADAELADLKKLG